VHTDPGKVWNLKIQIFQAWKVVESGLGPGKSFFKWVFLTLVFGLGTLLLLDAP